MSKRRLHDIVQVHTIQCSQLFTFFLNMYVFFKWVDIITKYNLYSVLVVSLVVICSFETYKFSAIALIYVVISQCFIKHLVDYWTCTFTIFNCLTLVRCCSFSALTLLVGRQEGHLACKNKKLSYRRGTARCVVSIEILPIATQQCRNYLYKFWPNRWYEVGDLVWGNAW